MAATNRILKADVGKWVEFKGANTYTDTTFAGVVTKVRNRIAAVEYRVLGESVVAYLGVQDPRIERICD